MWSIVNRNISAQVRRGAYWFTIEKKTYVGNYKPIENGLRGEREMRASIVSDDAEIANIVNAINALNGRHVMINFSKNVNLESLER